MEYLETFEEEVSETTEEVEIPQKKEAPLSRVPSRKEIKDRVRIPSSMQVSPCPCGGVPQLHFENDLFLFECPLCRKRSSGGHYLAEAIIFWNTFCKEEKS